MFAGVFPRSWQDGAAAIVVATALIAALVRVVRAARSFGHRIDKILHKVEGLDDVKIAAEQAKLASEEATGAANQATGAANRATDASNEARDEWRGATRAIREMADGHGGLLKSHADQLIDHEARISKLEGGPHG